VPNVFPAATAGPTAKAPIMTGVAMRVTPPDSTPATHSIPAVTPMEVAVAVAVSSAISPVQLSSSLRQTSPHLDVPDGQSPMHFPVHVGVPLGQSKHSAPAYCKPSAQIMGLPTPLPYESFAQETPMSAMPLGQSGEQMQQPKLWKPSLHLG